MRKSMYLICSPDCDCATMIHAKSMKSAWCKLVRLLSLFGVKSKEQAQSKGYTIEEVIRSVDESNQGC